MNESTVSILIPDVSGYVIWAATGLARSLQPDVSVEIVGPDMGTGVNPMYKDCFDYKPVSTPRLYRWPDYIWESEKLARAVNGKIIIAVKAFMSTVPVALRLKRRFGKKVIVYLDEWDGALYAQRSGAGRLRCWLQHAHHPLEDCYTPWVEGMIPQADAVVSTSTFLQRRFGGQIVPLGVDTEVFKPQDPGGTSALRRSLGLEGCRLIVFAGVVRPHKGVERILDALAQIGNRDYRLVVVGPKTAHLESLMSDGVNKPYIYWAGIQPREKVPPYLDLADAVVLPLEDTLLAQSQVPCKIFEAMAMAKPVIASAVSDLPAILEGCGRVVPSGDVKSLASAIEAVLSDEQKAREMGKLAREKCQRFYSQEQTGQQWRGLVGQLLR